MARNNESMNGTESGGGRSFGSTSFGAVFAAAIFGITCYLGFLVTESLVVRPRDADWVFGILAIVPLLVTVAMVAFATQRRLFFLLGMFGACAGPLIMGSDKISAPVIYQAELTAFAWFWCGLAGVAMALIIDRWVDYLEKRSDFRFSISDTVQLIFLVTVLIWVYVSNQ